eukprot:783397-Amphidinium_carterae.1
MHGTTCTEDDQERGSSLQGQDAGGCQDFVSVPCGQAEGDEHALPVTGTSRALEDAYEQPT